jgi:hypothetical protein
MPPHTLSAYHFMFLATMSDRSAFKVFAKLPGARQHVNHFLLSALQHKTYRWPFPSAQTPIPLAFRLGALLSGISCLLCVRLLHDTSRFQSDCMHSVVLLLLRCSSAFIPLRNIRAQHKRFAAALVRREGALQAALSAAQVVTESADCVAQAI